LRFIIRGKYNAKQVLQKMSGYSIEDEIEGEIIVLGRNDGNASWKWFGETVNPMKIAKEIIPTLEERMETLDELVRHNFINEGEYKLKTDRLQKLWKTELGEDEDEIEDESEDGDEVEVEDINIRLEDCIGTQPSFVNEDTQFFLESGTRNVWILGDERVWVVGELIAGSIMRPSPRLATYALKWN